ncbi:MAG: hypothetical protein QW487_02895 [Candidatus Bathyarchaeia archaeon]|nr:hypothetical protein [Candidatus Bathyarchaeota archaeon]
MILRKIFYYCLTGFLLALILVLVNSFIVEQKIAVKQLTAEKNEPEVKALINKPSINLISQDFPLLIYALIAGLTVYLIVKHYYVKEDLK